MEKEATDIEVDVDVDSDSDIDGDADSDVVSDGKEEEEVFRSEAVRRDVEEARLQQDVEALLQPDFVNSEEKEELYKARLRDCVQGLKSWREFKPGRVKALCACVKEDETHLSFEPGDVITGVRPAAWLTNPRWLEGTLNGRVGLVYTKDVEYLRDSPE